MAVRLEGSIKRFIGLSTDAKPRPFSGAGDANRSPLAGDMEIGEPLPAGSSFLETDTGSIYRWDGVSAWTLAAAQVDETSGYLAAILAELTMVREMLEAVVNA